MRRRSTISSITLWKRRWRGLCPSVRHTLQNEQCFGHPRMVCTEAHIYLSRGIRSQRAARNSLPSMRPPSYALGLVGEEVVDAAAPGNVPIAFDYGGPGRL